MWTGGADILAPPGTNPIYRDKVAANLGGMDVDDVLRVFIAPGVGHCGGGEGPNEFDMLSALEDWVEHDNAPDRIIASRVRTDGSVSRSMPLCPFPGYARYSGKGDPSRAGSFLCVAPE